MKKLISLLIAMIITVGSMSVFAETTVMEDDFSIRNGIKFGMTVEEVREIEEGEVSGNTVEVEIYNSSLMGTVKKVGYHKESIAGIPCTGNGENLMYYFNINSGLLEEIGYWYGYYDSASGKEYYNELYNLMCEKYGNPLHDNDGKLFDIITNAFVNYFLFSSGGSSPKIRYAEWLKEFNDTWVVVDVVLNEMTAGKPELVVGYRSVSKEEMTKLVGNAAREEAEKTKERNSDI